MQLVKNGWYRLYWGLMLVFSLVIAASFGLSEASYRISQYTDVLNLTPTIAILAGVQLLYSITLYWWIKRYSEPLALVIVSMLFLLVLLGGLAQASPNETGIWVYVAAWLVSAALTPMYGLPFMLGAAFFALVYSAMQSGFEIAETDRASIVLVVGTVVVGTLGYLFWRTQFKSVEEAQLSQLSGQLKSKQAQSAILIQSLTDGVIVTDTEGKINLINPSASHLTNWPVEDAVNVDARLVAKLADDSGKELSKQDNPFTKVLATQKHLTQTLQLTDKNGSNKIISLAISPVMAADHMSGVVAVMRDVSAEHAAEQQRAEFISTASHEMRTPVAAIEGYLGLALSEKVSTIDNRARSYLEKAHASTQHLGKLFQDLLTSAKAEDGRLSSHPEVVEMGGFMESLLGDLKISAETKSLSANLISGEGQTIDATSSASNLKVVKPLYYVYADPDRLREVITNLFDNAVKYTDQGKITLGLTGNTDIVQFFVRDTGAGIPADDVPHLFQKFYRVDTSATRVVGGTGLGLFISRKIIELYGGRIWAESELGKGSTFYVNLPRLSTQRAEQMQAQQTPSSTTA